MDAQQQADRAQPEVRRREVRVHGLSAVGSGFMSRVLAHRVGMDGRSGRGTRRRTPGAQRQAQRQGRAHATKLTNRQYEQLPARKLRQHPPRARVARHPHPAAHRGGRARLAPQQQPASYEQLPPVHAGGPAGQRRLQDRRRGQNGEYLGARGIKFYAPPRRPPRPRSRAAGSWRPSWWRPRACSAAAARH